VDAPPVLQSSKHILDFMAFFIGFPIMLDRLLSVSFCRYTRSDAHSCWGGRPHGIECQNWLSLNWPRRKPSTMKYKRIAVDTSKSVFTLHGVDTDEKAILRKDLTSDQFLSFFSSLDATDVYLEACGSSHHWARKLIAAGHRAHLIPPQYVKPFVKRGKNDRNDAQAISDAASRPDINQRQQRRI
jgi:hypothetical protein